MNELKQKILSEYGLDIDKTENLFKMYQIKDPEISDDVLNAAIEKAHKRWNISINGANEEIAERDKSRLGKADIYESILKDKNLRAGLFDFYVNADAHKLDFAKQYFSLLSKAKKITDRDVNIYFEYYPQERIHTKQIMNYVAETYGIVKDTEISNDMGSKNLQTIEIVSKAFMNYETAIKSESVINRYPELKKGLNDFLEVDKATNKQIFETMISNKTKKVFEVRREHGADYIPVVDICNTVKNLVNNDFGKNYEAWKLLFKYKDTLPIFCSIKTMSPQTLKDVIELVKNDSQFVSKSDFIANYYKPVSEEFGIDNSAVEMHISKALKNMERHKMMVPAAAAIKLEEKLKIAVTKQKEKTNAITLPTNERKDMAFSASR